MGGWEITRSIWLLFVFFMEPKLVLRFSGISVLDGESSVEHRASSRKTWDCPRP